MAAREALIGLATLGTGNFIRAGVETTTRGAYLAARLTHAGLTGYEYGSAAYDVYSGIQAVREGNQWGWLQIGLGAIPLAAGAHGLAAQIRAGRHGFRPLTNPEIGRVAENIARRRLARRFSNVQSLQNRSGHGIDLGGFSRSGEARFFEVKGSGGFTAPRLSRAQRNMRRFVRTRLNRAAERTAPWWRTVDPQVQSHALALQDVIRPRGPQGYLVEVTNLNSFFHFRPSVGVTRWR